MLEESETIARLSKVLGKIEMLSDSQSEKLDTMRRQNDEIQSSLINLNQKIEIINTGLEKRLSSTMKKFMESELNIDIK